MQSSAHTHSLSTLYSLQDSSIPLPAVIILHLSRLGIYSKRCDLCKVSINLSRTITSPHAPTQDVTRHFCFCNNCHPIALLAIRGVECAISVINLFLHALAAINQCHLVCALSLKIASNVIAAETFHTNRKGGGIAFFYNEQL
jgi:hypothetical protein